jgi:hypothetical protein
MTPTSKPEELRAGGFVGVAVCRKPAAREWGVVALLAPRLRAGGWEHMGRGFIQARAA